MPRFFFHLFDDLDVPDGEGMDLPDHATARARALMEARVMAAQAVRQGRLNLEHRIEVTDERGAIVVTVSFGEAVSIT
jgi:hypothetical protein